VEVDAPLEGTLSLNTDGSFTYSSGDFIGRTEFSYRVGDGTVEGNVVRVLLDVTTPEANHFPIGIRDAYSTSSGDTLTVDESNGLLVNDDDIDGDNLSVTIGDPPHYGTLSNVNANGSFEYKAPTEFSGIDWFTYQLSDGSVNTGSIIVKIEVVPINQTPIAADDSYSTEADVELKVPVPGVLGNDSDPENDDLTAVLIASPSNGTIEFERNGSFVYVPDEGFAGEDSFSYNVSDGNSSSDAATVSITVNKSNAPPVAVEDEYSTNVNKVLLISASGVLGNDSDPENDRLSVELETDAVHGDLTLCQDGAFSYLPNADFIGDDSFQYSLFDGHNYSVPVVVSIHIQPVDVLIPPLPVPDSYFISENSLLSVPAMSGVMANDLLGNFDSVTAIEVVNPGSGEFTMRNDGGFSFDPEENFTGDILFQYQLAYGEDESDSANVKISVVATNLHPVACPDSYSVSLNDLLQVPIATGILNNDFSPDNIGTLSASIVDVAHFGNVSLNNDGSFEYQPDPDFTGTDWFSYTAVVDTVVSGTVFVRIKVVDENGNKPPSAQDDVYSTSINTSLHIEEPGVLANDSDPEGGALSAIIVSSPSNGTLELNHDGSFVYSPNLDFSGDDSFDYSVSDGSLNSEVATVTINIEDNNVPISDPDEYFTHINQSFLIPAPGVLANDSDLDGDILTATEDDSPLHGELIFNEDGSFLYIPETDFTGTDSFSYYVEDNYDSSDSVTVRIAIAPLEEDCPIVALQDFYSVSNVGSLNLDRVSGVLSNDFDPDGELLSAVLLNDAQQGALSFNEDGSFTYVPNAGFEGVDSFAYRATDGVSYTDAVTVTLSVLDENSDAPPIAVFDKYYSPQGKSFFISSDKGVLSNDFDPDSSGDLLITVDLDSYYGMLSMNEDGSFSYEPEDEDFSGIDFFSYFISDGVSTSRAATVMIVITPDGTNNPPEASDDSYTMLANSTLHINVPGLLSNDSDPDGDSLQALKVSDPIHGSLVLKTDGSFSYSPLEGFVGEDSFTYVANDSRLNSNTANVVITVTGTGNNNPPIAQDDSFSLVISSSISISSPGVLSNDYDPDGDDITVTLVEDVSDGTLELNSDGSFFYESDAVEPSQDWFVYNVTDSNGAVSTNATVTITAVANHVPVTRDDTFFAKPGIPLIVPPPGILSNDSDADNEVLTVASDVEMPENEGELFLYDNGGFVFIPAENFTGNTLFSYYAEDENDQSNISNVTILIAPDDTANSQPTPNSGQYYMNANSMLVISALSGVLANDVDADYDNISVVKVSDPIHGDLTLNQDGSFVYYPQNSFSGTDFFSYKLSDGNSVSSPTTVRIDVLPSNVEIPPTTNCDLYTLPQNKTCFFPSPGVLGNDLNFDLNNMNVELVDDANYGFVTLNEDGSFEYEPEDEDFTGWDWFSYCVESEIGESNTVFVSINVLPEGENSTPIAQNDVFYSKQDVDLVIAAPGILLNDCDFDNDALSVNLLSIPIRGFLTLNADGSFTYTPSKGFFGQDKFTYSVTDSSLESKPATVIINVLSNNDNAPPVALDDKYTIIFNKNLNVEPPGVLENDFDPEGENLSVSLVEEPYYGSVTLLTDGSFKYEPDLDFYGEDWFKYRVTDPNGLYTDASVLISVQNNHIPLPEPDSYDLAWNTPLRVFADDGVLANDYDEDGDSLSAYVDEDVSHGYLDLNEDGSFEYVPDEDFYGDSDWFTYYVDDDTDESEPVKVILKVACQNITVGSIVTVGVNEISNDLMDSTFAKTPKIYGVYGNGLRGTLKKLPKLVNPMPSESAKAVWKKKYSLFYNTNDIKEYGYSGWFAWNILKPLEVKIWLKYKTNDKIGIEEEIKTVFLAPPRFQAFLDSSGHQIDPYMNPIKPGTILIIKGKYFGASAPKVSLEFETDNERYKYIKLKVLKEASFTDFKGNPNSSYMNLETGESLIKVVIPTKKIQPGEIYPLIIDNKIGVAADYDGNLPEISIQY